MLYLRKIFIRDQYQRDNFLGESVLRDGCIEEIHTGRSIGINDGFQGCIWRNFVRDQYQGDWSLGKSILWDNGISWIHIDRSVGIGDGFEWDPYLGDRYQGIGRRKSVSQEYWCWRDRYQGQLVSKWISIGGVLYVAIFSLNYFSCWNNFVIYCQHYAHFVLVFSFWVPFIPLVILFVDYSFRSWIAITFNVYESHDGTLFSLWFHFPVEDPWIQPQLN